MSFFPLDAFFAILVTLGPLKVMLVFAERTRDLEPVMRRRIAVKAVTVATAVGLLFIVLGKFLMDLFHFSLGALQIAGGAILFIFAVSMVLSSDGDEQVDSGKDPTEMAVFPLAMPLMATPIGIVTLTLLSAQFNSDVGVLMIVAVLLLIVMAINLGVLIGESRIMKYLDPQAIGVAERILGILLAALAVQTVLNGLAGLGIVVLKNAGHG